MGQKLLIILLSAIVGTTVAFPDWNKYLHPPYLQWKIGTCRFNIYQEDFNATEFFQGKWHGLKSFGNLLLQSDGVCPTMVSEVDGADVSILIYQYETLLRKYIYLRGNADLNKVDKSNYVIKYDFLAGLTSVKIPFSVLGTDYENYAVIYSCQEAFGLIAEMGWISTRKPGDKSHLKDIQEIVDLAGLQYSDFIEEEAMNCPRNPPEL